MDKYYNENYSILFVNKTFVVKSEKIELAILTREDVPEIWRLLTDPEVNRYLNARWRIHYLENEYEWYENLTKRSESERAFSVCESNKGKLVGVAFLNEIDFKNRKCHIGYFLDKEYWKKGLTTEAVRLLKYYCFNELNMRKLHTSTFEPNIGSKRVLEKNGFELIGKYKSHVYVPSIGFVDECIYEVFNDDLDSEIG